MNNISVVYTGLHLSINRKNNTFMLNSNRINHKRARTSIKAEVPSLYALFTSIQLCYCIWLHCVELLKQQRGFCQFCDFYVFLFLSHARSRPLTPVSQFSKSLLSVVINHYYCLLLSIIVVWHILSKCVPNIFVFFLFLCVKYTKLDWKLRYFSSVSLCLIFFNSV